MKNASEFCTAICCICIAVSVLSILIPQKRTSKIMGFVIGLFLISSVIGLFATYNEDLKMDFSEIEKYAIPDYSEEDYNDAALQLTADNLTVALNELLLNEDIRADDILISLKITNEGRIYASRIVIYISEAYAARRNDIKSIVYGNLSKEPEIYVTGREAQRDTQ